MRVSIGSTLSASRHALIGASWALAIGFGFLLGKSAVAGDPRVCKDQVAYRQWDGARPRRFGRYDISCLVSRVNAT